MRILLQQNYRASIAFFSVLAIVGLYVFIPFCIHILQTFFDKNSTVGELVEPKYALATYQFSPTAGKLVNGTEVAITSVLANATEGVNTGSWKGTLADDNFHWVVAGINPGGVDVQLDVGRVQLNGANKLIIQTEFDLDATVLATKVQICDWVSSTDVDTIADGECTGGGWRTLNTKNASQVAVDLVQTGGVAFQWNVYNGYWSTGTTGGTPIDTPLTNFVNGSNQIKVRYYATTNTTSQIAIDYLRVYAVIDPVYHPAGFTKDSGGTTIGHYGNASMMGNTGTIQQVAGTGDGLYLQVPGTAGVPADFYLTFKNVKTYTGMNTILVNTDAACSVATPGLQYRFKIRNFTTSSWEDISSTLDCSTTNYFNNFAKNNITIGDYINGSNEIWVGMYALSNSTTVLQLDSMYIMLGTTNTDTALCEISYGTSTAGRIAENPSAPGSDRINAITNDGTYMYVAGYDSIGIDNEWRLEKRNLSDGALVTAFDGDGIVTTDPSTGIDQIYAIATTSGAIFIAGSDVAAGAGQWRIEKRDSTDGSLITAFNTTGILTYNAGVGIDGITSIAVDASYLYVAGYQDSVSGTWRIHKYDITDDSSVLAFNTTGMISEALAASGIERPESIKVDADYLYIAGYDNVAGTLQWRLEKRNKTTGALCAGGGECASGAFDTDGVVQNNPSANPDYIYTMAIDGSYIYLGGSDGALSAANGQWRIEKRDIATGALVGAFNTTGIIQKDPNNADIDIIMSIITDDSYLYIGGFQDDDAGIWYLEKRDKTTGALVTSFSTDGIMQSDDGGDDRINAMTHDGTYLYVGGYGTAPGDNQWLIEKVDIGTGLRTNDTFGSNDCTGTRNIDITGGNRDAWAIQTEDESASFARPFYALDNDGDAALEEAGAANIGFSVVVPTNATVSGVYWAGRVMSGAGGTVRLGLKDYSGLTGTIGGRSLVGASPVNAMLYNDPLVTAGAGSGGWSGYMTNPEDYIDTVNNKMNMGIVTTVTTSSSTNSVNVWDFAMVSFSWVETTEGSPVYSIVITSDGTIEYGYVDLSTATTTLESNTQTAQNDGTIPEKLNVRSSDAVGGVNWALSTAIGSNVYKHEFSTTSGASWVTMPDNATYVVADGLVTASDSVNFDFRLTAPSDTTDFQEKNITITIQAVAP